jgi:hypothetical protein
MATYILSRFLFYLRVNLKPGFGTLKSDFKRNFNYILSDGLQCSLEFQWQLN